MSTVKGKTSGLTIGVIGLGYVGLPLAVAFAEAADRVIALDTDIRKIAAIDRGDSYIEDISNERLQDALPLISATTRYAQLAKADAIIICVPTPLTRQREPELGPLYAAARGVRDVLQAGQLIVLQSTTFPGTTRDHFVPILEESGLKLGRDFNVAFSPERVDPGRTDFDLRSTPKLIGGMTETCTSRAEALYARVCEHPVTVSTPEVAELAKLLENIYRSVNIALVNEMAIIADRMGIDIWEVVDAASTKPYGFTRFEPGPGMGGHCLPVDPFYLTWKAREYDMATEFIELAGKVNQQMPNHCVERIERVLNNADKPVKGTRIAIFGVAYKAGTSDVRESPAIRIIDLLRKRGADLIYHDPYVPDLNGLELAGESFDVALRADLAVIVTAHPDVDYQAILDRVPLVLDLRGHTRKYTAGDVTQMSPRPPITGMKGQ
jgi:UDP-N-acetyl-D-glucosamine dehydrogenase